MIKKFVTFNLSIKLNTYSGLQYRNFTMAVAIALMALAVYIAIMISKKLPGSISNLSANIYLTLV